MENPPGTERKGSLSKQQHMTGILVTGRLTQLRLLSLRLSQLLLRSTPMSWSPLSSSPKQNQKNPTHNSSLWKRWLCSGSKLIKKERTNCSPPGSAWPGCSQNKPVYRLQQVSFSELKGSPTKQFFFFSSGISMGKLKINETNQSLLAATVSADASFSKTQAWYGAWELFTRQNGLLHTRFYKCSLPSLWLWVMFCFWTFMFPSYQWIYEIALLCSRKQPNKPELH